MKFFLGIIAFGFVGMLSACADDAVEKCVKSQVKVADEAEKAEKEAAEKLKLEGGTIDWGKYINIRETPAQVEAKARLECLKASSGKP